MKKLFFTLTCLLLLLLGKVTNAQVGKFDLLSPPNSTALKVYSGNSTKIDISWKPSKNATEYYWVADKSGASFSPALLRIASNSKATDTVLTVTSGDLDNLLAGFGLIVGQSIDLDWKVVAIDGKDSIYSNSTYSIKLTRGVTLGNFDLVSPATSSKVTSFRGSNQPINITWNSSKNANNYTWHVDLPSGNFSKPLASIKSNNSGKDTVLTLTSADVDTLLAQLGLNQGDSVDVIWTVTSTDTLTKDLLFANKPFDISLKRSKISAFSINTFSLLNPTSGTSVKVFENSSNQIQINWSKSNSTGLKYSWKAYISGSFSKGAILNFDSDNGGNDTTLTLTQGAIDNILATSGIAKGGSLTLDWNVYATDPSTGNSKVSSNLFTITLTRGNGKAPNFTDFGLISPADKTVLTVYKGGKVNVNINWNSSTGANKYEWLATTTTGNFISPLLSFKSNNSGLDTVLTLISGDIDNILASAGLIEGNSITLRWTVKATDTITNTSKFSKNVYEITLTRGFNLSAFKLNSPSNKASLTVYKGGNVNVNINWNSSKRANKYEWLAITTTGNFASPLLSFKSNNSGLDTVLTLVSGDIDNILASAGITEGNSITLKWMVKATDTVSANSKSSNDTFEITLTRGLNLGAFNLDSPTDSAKVIVKENSSNLINIKWNRSKNANKYSWIAILPNGNFNNPTVSFKSNNKGIDTVLSLSEDAVDKLLASLGLQKGQNTTLSWTVRAEDTVNSLSLLATQTRTVILERGVKVNINENKLIGQNIHLFPNPAIDKITIDGLNGNSMYQIIDLKGRLQLEGNLLSSNNQIDINGLRGGSYLIKILNGGNVITKILQVK